MKAKIILGATALATALAVAGWLLSGPAPEKTVAANPPRPASLPVPDSAPEITPGAVTSNPATAKIVSNPKPAKKSAQKNNPAGAKAPLQDPDARVALSLVGVDPDAEAYWLSAISDPSLPDQEREDLMEDLNEDGLSDPKHPGPEDIPLIVNRIALIEQILPDADPFMQQHLGEASKDLNDMLAGKTVK